MTNDSAILGLKDKVLIFLAGFCLLNTQYIFSRIIGSTFFSTELILIFSTIIILIGISFSYAIGIKLNDKEFQVWTLLTFIMCLSLPVSPIIIYIFCYKFKIQLIAYLIIAILGFLILGGYFAVFLPKFISRGINFNHIYIFELLGSLTCLFLLFIMNNFMFNLFFYYLALFAITLLTLNSKVLKILSAILVIVSVNSYAFVNEAVLKQYYHTVYQANNPQIVYTEYSNYYRIDVVSSLQGTSLYLDGVPYYDNNITGGFNYSLSYLPGRLKKPTLKPNLKALVVGSGSLSSSSYLKSLNYDVTVCEIDPKVLEAGLRFFQFKNHLQPQSLNIKITDCRNYLLNLPDASLDIIAMDVPAPYHLQTAMLHTKEFYSLAKQKLKPDGLISICLCSYGCHKPLAKSIAKGLGLNFPYFIKCDSRLVNLSFIYGSQDSSLLNIDELKKIVSLEHNSAYFDFSYKNEIWPKVKNEKALSFNYLLPALFIMSHVL